MVMAVAGGVTGNIRAGKSYTQATSDVASFAATNAMTMSTAHSINASRSASVAGAAQALANQTGGNIMGFTYE